MPQGLDRILASCRPDLIEVDLKRPGRIDVKIPLFPTTTAEESLGLIRALSEKRGIQLQDSDLPGLESLAPLLLTPGAAETLAVKIYRPVRTSSLSPLDAVAGLSEGLSESSPAGDNGVSDSARRQ